jgi:tetratricopeptide (TPR) repeat protein
MSLIQHRLATIHAGLAQALQNTGDSDGATQAFAMVRKLSTDNDTGQVNYGLALARNGEIDAAIGAFRRSFEVFARGLDQTPDDVTTQRNLRAACVDLVHWLRVQGRSEEAVPYLDRARNMGVDDRQFWMEYALCHRELGHNAEVERGCQQVAGTYPAPDQRNAADWAHLSQDFYRLGRYQAAREGLEKTIKLRHDDGPSLKGGPRWWYYTLVLCQMGETDQARVYYDQLAQMMKDEPPSPLKPYDDLRVEAARLLKLNSDLGASASSAPPSGELQE